MSAQKEPRRCTWEHCPRPEEPVYTNPSRPARTAEALHQECRSARAEQGRRCQWGKCPTPEKPLSKSARSRGSTMHRACSARAQREGSEPIPPPICGVCRERPILRRTARLCDQCRSNRARRAQP